MRAHIMVVGCIIVVTSGCVSENVHQDAMAQLRKLQAQNAELEKAALLAKKADADCAAAKKQLADMATNMKASAAELEALRKQREETEKRLAAFKALTARFKSMIDSGALRVRIRDGKMLVEMASGVLFKSGSALLSPKGQTTLGQVAGVLRDVTDRRFVVAGHTDNVPIKSSEHKDNWDLSTARALMVTKFLIGAGMQPNVLAAAGYNQYDKAASNKTVRGRALNRRIEIILQPNLGELPKLPE